MIMQIIFLLVTNISFFFILQQMINNNYEVQKIDHSFLLNFHLSLKPNNYNNGMSNTKNAF